MAAVVALGLCWWLLARTGQATTPVAIAPVPAVAAPRAELAPSESSSVGQRVELAPAPVAPRTELAPVHPSIAAAPAAATPVGQRVELALAPAVPSAPPAAIDEVAATERMYAAHAPLRTREVADPDSESNRRILQTMVTKALTVPASATAAPTGSTTH